MMKHTQDEREVSFFYHIGQLIIYLLAINLLLVTLLFFFNISISAYTFPITIILSIFFLCIFYQEKFSYRIIGEIIVFLIVLGMVVLISGCLCDVSYDGNYYHKFAVGLFQNGWNPVYETSENYSQQIFGCKFGSLSCLWLDHYCKQTWIFGASVYSLTKNIETGKVYIILSMIGVFCLIYSYLKAKEYKRWQSIIIGIVTSCNPVAIAQVNTFYVDGYLFNIFFALVIALIMNMDFEFKYSGKSSASLIACAMIVCANIKFTGLLYGGLYCIAYFIFWVILEYRRHLKNWIKHAFNRCKWFALLALVCIVWPGYSSYVMNFLQHGSPTYPLTGSGAVDIMTSNTPHALLEMNRISKLFYSLFSKMNNNVNITSSEISLKIPFSFYQDEKMYLGATDTRIGGFGIFFSGILVLSVIILVYLLTKLKGKKILFTFCCLNIGLSVALSIIIAESWWARYAPFIYLIILEALILLFREQNRNGFESAEISSFSIKNLYKRIFSSKVFAVGFSILFIVNNMLFLCAYDYKSSLYVLEEINSLTQYQNTEIDFGNFPGFVFNYLDTGISFEINETVSENPNSIPAYFGGIYYLYDETE